MPNIELPSRPIALIGMMGSGKSTLARTLSERLRRPCIDLDQAIEHHEGRAIRAIFSQSGEAYFRQAEHRMLATLLEKHPDGILATGGGIILDEANRTLLRERTCVIFLDVPIPTLVTRLQGDQLRPLLQQSPQENLQRLYDERLSLYRSTAHHTLNIDATPIDQTVERLITLIASNTYVHTPPPA